MIVISVEYGMIFDIDGVLYYISLYRFEIKGTETY